MNLNDHPILMQGYDVIQAIEECGASVKLTNAVILAGELLDEINKLVGENKLYEEIDRLREENKKLRKALEDVFPLALVFASRYAAEHDLTTKKGLRCLHPTHQTILNKITSILKIKKVNL